MSCSNFGILNWDSPTRLPGNANPSSPDVSLASASLITSTNWQGEEPRLRPSTNPHYIADGYHYQPDITSFQHLPGKGKLGPIQCREIEDKLSKGRLPTNCQKGEKILRAIILKAASHHIPSGRHRFKSRFQRDNGKARDDLRSRDSTSPALPEMNDEITRITNEHKRLKWRQLVETLDHKTGPTKL